MPDAALVEALERIRDGRPAITNSTTAHEQWSWASAVAATALADLSQPALPREGWSPRKLFQIVAEMCDEARKIEREKGEYADFDVTDYVTRLAASPPPPDLRSEVEEDWYDQVEDLLDNYSDAEIIDGTTHPNKAMRLLYQLREARGQ